MGQSACSHLRFDLVWKNCECVICPEMTLYTWKNVVIQQLANLFGHSGQMQEKTR